MFFNLFRKKNINKISDIKMNEYSTATLLFLSRLKSDKCSSYNLFKFFRNSKFEISNDYSEFVQHLVNNKWIESKDSAVKLTEIGKNKIANRNLSKVISEKLFESIDKNVAFINAHYVENISEHVLKKEKGGANQKE